MQIRSRTGADINDADQPVRLGSPARDIVAAVLLTLAAIVFIAVASTDGPQHPSDLRRQEAAAEKR